MKYYIVLSDTTYYWRKLVKTRHSLAGKDVVTRVLRISGEVDYRNSKDLLTQFAAVISSGARTLIVDLTKTSHLSDDGLNCLAEGLRMFIDRSGRVVINCPKRRTAWSLKNLGLDKDFKIVNTITEATHLIQSPAY